VREQAAALAEHSAEAKNELARLERLYRDALRRSPSLAEAADAHEFLAVDGEKIEASRWEELAQVLLMSNEFMFVD
jgi:hypothetical protein